MKQKFKWITILIIILVLFSASTIYCNNQNSTNSIQKGAKALQFQIGRDFMLSSFQGALISYKWHSSDKTAWRIGLSLDAEKKERSSDRTYQDTLTSELDDNRKSYVIGITTQYVIYPYPEKNIQFYYGIGPIANYGYAKYVQKNINKSNEISSTTTSTSTSWSVGISLVSGLEWFVKKNISIHSEYGISLKYQKVKTTSLKEFSDNSNEMKRNDSLKWYLLKPMPVKFGLSVYF